MIVFVDENPQEVAPLRDAFLRLRIHTACVTPHTVAHIGRYPAHAVLIPRPECLENLEIIAGEIKSHFPNLPFAILYKRGNPYYYRYCRLCDTVIDSDTSTPREIGEYLHSMYEYNTGRSLHAIMLESMRTLVEPPYLTVFLHHMDITPTQWLILRYLQHTHPTPVTAEEILDTCFLHTKPPSVSNVRTQICAFNQKLRSYFGLVPIVYVTKQGYVLSPKRVKRK